MANTGLMVSIITVFIFLGVLLPFINRDLDSSYSGSSTSALSDSVASGNITTGDVLLSIFKMFFWTFGALPFWLDAIFLIFRITLGVIIYDKSPLGKGG